MGSIYVVDQLSTGRKRALKLMHPDLVKDEKLRERFAQEARIGSRIDREGRVTQPPRVNSPSVPQSRVSPPSARSHSYVPSSARHPLWKSSVTS